MDKKTLGQRFREKVTTAYIAKIAVLSALAFVMYMYVKFKLPFMFPSFLEMQFSELPALLAGFSLGPVAGCLVVIIKCLIKLPFTSTAFVGEIMDILVGVTYVLPASLFYCKNKTKKNAIIGLIIGSVAATVLAMLYNRVVAVPFYVKMFFGNNFSSIVNMMKPIYKSVNEENFYYLYIFVGVLPFNLLRLGLVSLITFFVYKRLTKILHWDKKSKVNNELTSESLQEVEKNDINNNGNL